MTTQRPALATDEIDVCEGVSVREFDGDWVVLDLNGGNYFGLDELGGMIWQHLREGKSAQQIVTALAPLYHVDQETMLRDVLVLIDQLLERGLVRVREPS
jgi:hypothetical protein